MKADEALTKPGDAARRDSDGALLTATYTPESGRVWACSIEFLPEDHQVVSRGCFADTIPGDDWQPLVTKPEGISIAGHKGYQAGVKDAESDAAAKIAELEAEVERLTKDRYQQVSERQATIRSLEKERADLTAKLAAVEDGAAFVGEEWFPMGSSVGQLSWLIYRGAAHKDDKMKLVQVRTENLAVAANRYFRYTGPKWAAPLPEPEPPTKPKCLEGVPAVLCRDEEGKEWWCHGTVSNGQVLMFRWYGGKSSWTAGFVAELTPIHHAPDAAGLAEEIRGESHGKPAPVNRK